MKREKEIHTMYAWVICVGVIMFFSLSGGSIKEIALNSLTGIMGFALLAIVMSSFFGDE